MNPSYGSLRALAGLLLMGAVLAGCGADNSPTTQPTPTEPTATSKATESDPTQTALTGPAAIPADFPLAIGMPGRGDADVEFRPPAPEDERMTEVEVCGEVVWPVGTAGGIQQLVTSASGPEWFDAHWLTVHADTEVATNALARIADTVRRCEAPAGQVWTPLPTASGDKSVAVGLTYTEGLGSTVLQFTRVGSALLLVQSGGEGSIDDLDVTARRVTMTTERLVRRMCGLPGAACPAEPRASRTTATPSVRSQRSTRP